MAERMNQYEAMFLFGPVAQQEPQTALDLPRQLIERHGGQILVIKKWDERRLAYEMGGQKRGTYVIAFYKGPGSSVTAIERDVNLSETILRVMITRADHLNQDEMNAVEPQPIQPREERNPWDRPSGGDRYDRGGDRGGDRGPREDRAPREDRGPRGPRREETAAPAAAGGGEAPAGSRE